MELGDWMGNLQPEVTRLPLCLLKIPGSHNSGADSSLNSSLPVANDEGKVIATLGSFYCIRKGIRRWAITQRLTVRDQLLCGVRYFDLRVSYAPNQLRKKIGDFHLVHGLYGLLLHDFLNELRLFLEEHPAEAVLLDVNHLFGVEQHTKLALMELIGEVLGWRKLCPPMPAEECTLDFMRSRGFQVIVFLSREDLGQFWSQLRITSPWPNTNKLATLVPYLEKMLEGDRPLHMNKYYVHQGVLTPTMKNVMAINSGKDFGRKSNNLNFFMDCFTFLLHD